jgi:hypothetical protein
LIAEKSLAIGISKTQRPSLDSAQSSPISRFIARSLFKVLAFIFDYENPAIGGAR